MSNAETRVERINALREFEKEGIQVCLLDIRLGARGLYVSFTQKQASLA